MNNASSFAQQIRVRVDRIRESGAAALAGLYDLAAHRLHRYAVTITRNQHDAEDVVQAVLVKVAGQPELLLRAECAWHYLLRMVRNEALLNHRKRARSLAILRLLDLRTHCEVDELEQQDTHRAIWKALRRLPQSQSEVVVLKIWESLTFSQIATILDESASTVASRYRYGMEKLSSFLVSHHPTSIVEETRCEEL